MKRPLPRTAATWLKEIKLAIADAMEIESLTINLQRRFQLNDAELSEMTLAEVVELMKSP